LKHEHEILGFLEQSRISEKNVTRLRTLARLENARIADLASLVLEVAVVTPIGAAGSAPWRDCVATF
jgi:hypothetical protein